MRIYNDRFALCRTLLRARKLGHPLVIPGHPWSAPGPRQTADPAAMSAVSLENVSKIYAPRSRGLGRLFGRARAGLPGPERRQPAHRARRVLRPAGPQRRRQDHADLHSGRPGARHLRPRVGLWLRRRGRLQIGATGAGRGAAGTGLRPVLHRARDAAHPVGLFRPAQERRLDRRDPVQPGAGRQGQLQHARAVRRHEAPRAGGAGAGAPPARDRAGRAHRRRGRGPAPHAVGIHLAPEQGRPHHHADHALPGRGRGPVRPHRHAQGRPRGGAGHHPGAAGARGRRGPGRRLRAHHASGRRPRRPQPATRRDPQ